MNSFLKRIFFLLSLISFFIGSFGQRVMEHLDRGLIAVPANENKVYIGWRLFASDEDDLGFNIYRTTGTATAKLNSKPITASTNFIDEHPNLLHESSYFIKPVFNGKELEQSKPFKLPTNSSIQK
jgi:rhamnogalacturonan endolyase